MKNIYGESIYSSQFCDTSISTIDTDSNLYGSSIYNQIIYSELEGHPFTGLLPYDFQIIWHNKGRNALVGGVYWWLYKRDHTLGEDVTVNESHILVDSGIANGDIQIALSDYGLRGIIEDYYIKTSKYNNLIDHVAKYYIEYDPTTYSQSGLENPYFRANVYVAEDKGSSDATPPRIIYRDKEKPLPKVILRRINTKDDIKDIDVIIIEIKELNV